VLASVTPVGITEVILVDSNSTDETVDIASEYPVTVLRITDDDRTGPSAGRHVGLERARGEYVLFVDGDMHLRDGWVEGALDRLVGDPDLAGVDGHLDGESGADAAESVEYLRGVALYDAAALSVVGGFDPQLSALEDVDLGLRLRHAGYRLERLPVVVGEHPTKGGVGERMRRWRRGYYFANGEVLRKSLGEPALLAYWLYRIRLSLFNLGWLAAGVLAVVVQFQLLAAWLACSAVGAAAVSAARGRKWLLRKAAAQPLIVGGIAVGFLRYGSTGDPTEAVEVVEARVPIYA
jgi:GT2 family glycosyltransferase